MKYLTILTLLAASVANAQKIDIITPKVGSINGGTRVSILGSGFDMRGRSNDVFIGTADGGVFCDPVPNDCTSSRIVCLTAAYRANGTMPLQVSANGVVATCGVSSGCTFRYTADNTPTVSSIKPEWISSPASITVVGTGFDRGDATVGSFDFFAWFGDEERCDLGSNDVSSTSFACAAENGLFPGSNRLTLQLGSRGLATVPDSVALTVIPSITEVSATAGSTEGGQIVTISGNFFSRTALENEVTIHGAPCIPTAATPSSIVCTTTAHAETTTAAAPTYAAGVQFDYWGGNVASDVSVIALRGKLAYLTPQVSLTLTSFGGSVPVTLESYCAARYTSWYVAPQSGNYTFVAYMDDVGELWVGTDETPVEFVRQYQSDDVNYNDQLIAYRGSYGTASGSVTLVAGKRYWIQMFVINQEGAFGSTLTITLPDGTKVVNPSSGMTIPTSPTWQSPVAVTSRGVKATYGAGCWAQGSCDFNYTSASTPVITAISPATGVAGTAVTLTGSSLTASANIVSVTLDGVVCSVTSATASQIVFTVPKTVAAGTHPVLVTILGSGRARISSLFTVQFALSSIDNSNGYLAISGTGLNVDASRITVTLGAGSACAPVTVVDGQIQCPPSSSLTAGTTAVSVSIADATTATAPLAFQYDASNDRPGTTTTPKSPALLTTTASLFAANTIAILVPAWSVKELADVTVTFGDNACEVIAVAGSRITCVAPSVYTPGAYEVTVTRVADGETFTLGSLTLAEKVTAASLSSLSSEGGNSFDVYTTGSPVDTATSTLDSALVMTYRGVPCKATLRVGFNTIRCFLDDSSLTAEPALTTLASFSASDANPLEGLQTLGAVTVGTNGYSIPAGASLFTRRSFGLNIRITAEVTPSVSTSTCIRMNAGSLDASATYSGMTATAYGSSFTVARDTWVPSAVASEDVALSGGSKNVWRLDVSNGYGAFFIDGTRVYTMNARSLHDGFVGFPVSCQAITVNNIKIEDLTPQTLQLTANGRTIQMFDEPIAFGTPATDLVLRQYPATVQVGGTMRVSLTSFVAWQVYLFPEGTENFQILPKTPTLCTDYATLTSTNLDGTVWSSCSVSNVPAGTYIARFRQTSHGFITTQVTITVTPKFTSIAPTTPSYNGALLTITGSGFNPSVTSDYTVTIGDSTDCPVIGATPTNLVCRLPAAGSSLGPFTVTAAYQGTTLGTGSITYATAAKSPRVTSITTPRGDNEYFVLYGANLGSASATSFGLIGGSSCTLGWGSATYVACRIRGDSPAAGVYTNTSISFHVAGSGYAAIGDVAVTVAKGFYKPIPTTTGTDGGATLTLPARKLNVDAGFTTVASFDFTTGSSEDSKWTITDGVAGVGSCGPTLTGFGGAGVTGTYFSKYTKATRAAISSLATHDTVSVTFELYLSGSDLPVEVTVDGKKYSLSDVASRPALPTTAAVSNLCQDTETYIVKRTFAVPHTASDVTVGFAVPSWYAGRSWAIRSYSVKVGATPLAVSIGSSNCAITYAEPNVLTCTSPAIATEADYSVTVTESGSPVDALESNAAATITYAASSNVALSTAVFATIPGTSTGSSLLWGTPARATTISGTSARVTVDGTLAAWSAGAQSQQLYYKDDGFIGATFQISGRAMFGLASGPVSTTAAYMDVDFSWYRDTTSASYVYEAGAYMVGETVVSSSVFSIRVESDDTVSYLVDDIIVYRSARKAPWPLRIDSSLYSTGSYVQIVSIDFASGFPAAQSTRVPVVLSGSNLPSDYAATISVNGVAAPILRSSANYVVVAVDAAVATLGAALSVDFASTTGSATASLTLAPAVTSISSIKGSTDGNHLVTIAGSGFTASPTVTIGSTACTVLSYTFNSVVCLTGANAVATNLTVAVSVSGTAAQCISSVALVDQTVVSDSCPVYSYVAPTASSTGASFANGRVTVTGTGFIIGDTSVMVVGSYVCTETTTSETAVSCPVPSTVAGGTYNVALSFGVSTGVATQSVTIPVTATLSATAIGSLGGAIITVSGANFGTSATLLNGATDVCASTAAQTGSSFVCVTAAGTFTSVVVSTGSSTSAALSITASAGNAPTITSVSPSTILGYAPVTITGTNFASVVTIAIGSADCTIVSQTSTSIICRAGAVPSGSVSVTIATSARGASTALTATGVVSVNAVANDGVGAIGSTITVIGGGFQASRSYVVELGETYACESPTVVDSSHITCVATGPSEFVDYKLDVSVTEVASTLTTKTGSYSHVVVFNPTIASVSPASGTKAGGVVLTITGTNFDNNPQNNYVTVGGARCMTVSSSSTELTCTTSAITTGVSGAVPVTVTTKGLPAPVDGTFTATLAVSAVSPSNAISVEGGLSVTISGAGFPEGLSFTKLAVTVGGIACPVESSTESTIVCTLGASPRPIATKLTELLQFYPFRSDNTALIRVVVNGSTADIDDNSLKIEFAATSTPTITSAVPATSNVYQGTLITITGTGFADSGNVVELLHLGLNGGVSGCDVQSESSTSIVCAADLVTFGNHFVQVNVPSVGYAKTQLTCPTGQYLTCDGQCLTEADCSYTDWGVFADCSTLLSILAGDAFCDSNGGSDRVNGNFKLDTGKVLNLNCPMYSCEAQDCNSSIAIGGRAEVVNTCGVDPNGFLVTARARITAIAGSKASSLYGGARLTITGTNLDLSSTFVIGGGAYCVPIALSGDDVVCETVAVTGAASGLSLIGYTSGVAADCVSGVCDGFSYVTDNVPIVSFIAPLRSDSRVEYQANSAITFTGTGFSTTNDENVISVGGSPCTVTSSSSTQIICTAAALYYGDYAITLRVSTIGLSATIATVARVRPIVSEISSNTSSNLGGKTITVTGSALVSQAGVATYTIGSCVVSKIVSASLTSVVFVTPACTTKASFVATVTSSSSCKAASCQITFNTAPAATAERVSATRVQISSTAATFDSADSITATIGNDVCTVVTFTSNTFQCDFPATHAAGTYPLDIILAGVGRLSLSGEGYTAFYDGTITSISPSSGSTGGSQSVTIAGTGFATDATKISVRVAGAYCSPTSLTATQIICTTSAVSAAVSGVVEVNNTAPFGSGQISGVSYAYSTASSPALTSVSPSQGSTAGGTMLTIVGTRLSNSITVTINGVVCTQTQAEQDQTTAANGATYYCTTGALATSRNAVLRAVHATNGAAVNTLTYDYIDLWSRWTTWGNTPPPQYGDSAVISEGQTIMMDYDSPRLFLIVVMGHLFFDETKNITLEATYIMINFGRFTIGTPEQPYVHTAVIRLYGDRLTPEIPVHGSKVLALRHGALDMHGIPRHPTFTKLAATANAYSSSIQVRGPVDWKAGEEIVITTTDFKMEHAEKRVITSVTNGGTSVVTIGINQPLIYTHNGVKECFNNNAVCIEEIADVMLLTRNIKVVGDNRTQSLGFGGTMFLMPMGQNSSMYARLSYIEMTDAGQQYIVGRYPIHFHIPGKSNNSFVIGCSVHRSLNRAYSVHGVSNNTYIDNVGYDIQGHAFFIEDGNEVFNNITHNIIALVHPSTSNLNTDLTPAAFWCVTPNNIIVNNIAAGSGAYGFWISPFHPYSTGPGYSTSVCPATHKILQFENNEAHAAKKYGLNIFQYLWPRNKECDFNNVYGDALGGSIKNHFSWKNKIHGVSMAHSEVGEIGSVLFENLVSANNGEDHEDASAFWVEHILATNMTFGIKKAFLIGQTSNAPHTSIHTRRGINLPLGDNFFAEDVTFINYQNENYGIEPQRWANRFSFCFPWGWEALFRRTKWVNAPNKMRMRFVHHGIINDEDGTFGSGTPNTQIIPQCEILDPALCPFVSGSPVTPTAACTAQHKLRRFGLASVNEVFSDQLFTVDDRSEIVPQITREYSMSIPANKVINIEFQSAYNPSTFKWSANDRFRQNNEKNIFQTLYKEVRAAANASFDGVLTAMMDRRPTLQDNTNGYFFGDKVATALVVAPTKGVQMVASTCPWDGCPIEPLEDAAQDIPCISWDSAEAWLSRTVPADGSALRISNNESICLDKPGRTYRLRSLYLGGKIEVNNSFCKPGDKITLYVEKYIHVRGGILKVGSAASPLACTFEIIIAQADFNDMGASTIVPWSARALVLEAGSINMYGVKKTTIAYLSQTSAAGSRTITLDRPVNWAVGDTIVVAQTKSEAPGTGSHRTEESEDVNITAINGNTITLSAPLAYSHFGAAPQTLNGVVYNIGAEVVCLTRTVKMTGGHYRGQTIEYNMGWNFHIGCTSGILNGCGDGDARLIGFPMGALKPGAVHIDSVQFDDIGQEGSIHGALNVDGLVTSTTELNARTSFVRNCAFNRVRAIGINIHSSTNALELTNNTLFNIDGDGIRVGGRSNTLDGNIIIKNSFIKPLCKKMYDATVRPDCVGGAFRINSGNTIINNIAASGDGYGFATIGESCDTTFSWKNNFAIRHQDGLVINEKLAEGGTPDYKWVVTVPTCRVVGGVNAFSNSDQGVAVWYATGDVTVRDVVVVDNLHGITSLLFNDRYDRGEVELQFVIEDSTVAGHWVGGQACSTTSQFRCRNTMVDSMEWCSTIYNEQMGPRLRGAGILETVFVDSSYAGRCKGESKFQWIEPDSYATVKGRAQIRNVFFDNFAGLNSCNQREVAFFQDFFSNDTFHQHTFENIQWGSNVATGAEFYAWSPYGDAKGTLTEGSQTVFMNYDDIKRGGYWPDAPHKVWLIDTDGSFSRTPGTLQTIFSSRTIARTGPFNQLGYDGQAFRNNGAPGDLKDGCQFVEAWNAYKCAEKRYVSLTIESYADDALTRRPGPIVMCKGDGMVDEKGWPLCQGGEADYASGPVMKAKEQRATLDRLARFRFTVEIGHNYTLSTRGQPPTWMRMWLHGHEYTGLSLADIGVVVNLRYFGEFARMRVGMYVDGLRQPVSFGYGNPYTISPPTTFPMPTDPAGTHYHNLAFYDTESGVDTKQVNVMSVTMRPNVYVDWKQESIIIVTATVAMTEEDFFDNKATFALALASVLGIDSSRLKFATIVAGTFNSRRKLMADASTSAEFHIEMDSTVLASNPESQVNSLASDLPEIFSLLNSNLTVPGFESASLSAEMIKATSTAPAVTVDKQYDYILLNVSRTDGNDFNATYFVEQVLAYTNAQLGPASGLERSLETDELSRGAVWSYADTNYSRIALFYTIEDDVRGSNTLTRNLFEILTSSSAALRAAATPANHVIVSAKFVDQVPDDNSTTLAAGFIVLIVVGVLVIVTLFVVAAVYAVHQRKKAQLLDTKDKEMAEVGGPAKWGGADESNGNGPLRYTYSYTNGPSDKNVA